MYIYGMMGKRRKMEMMEIWNDGKKYIYAYIYMHIYIYAYIYGTMEKKKRKKRKKKKTYRGERRRNNQAWKIFQMPSEGILDTSLIG